MDELTTADLWDNFLNAILRPPVIVPREPSWVSENVFYEKVICLFRETKKAIQCIWYINLIAFISSFSVIIFPPCILIILSCILLNYIVVLIHPLLHIRRALKLTKLVNSPEFIESARLLPPECRPDKSKILKLLFNIPANSMLAGCALSSFFLLFNFPLVIVLDFKFRELDDPMLGVTAGLAVAFFWSLCALVLALIIRWVFYAPILAIVKQKAEVAWRQPS